MGLEVSLYNKFSVPFIVVNLHRYNGSIIMIASVHSHRHLLKVLTSVTLSKVDLLVMEQ